MSILNMIAQGGSTRTPVEQYRRGIADQMAMEKHGYEMAEAARKEQKVQDEAMWRDQISQSENPEQRHKAEQMAIDAGFGQMVVDNLKAKRALKNDALLDKNTYNEQVLRYINALDAVKNDPVQAEATYQQAREYAIQTVGYPEDRIPKTYKEAIETGFLERERMLALASKEQFKQEMDRRNLRYKYDYLNTYKDIKNKEMGIKAYAAQAKAQSDLDKSKKVPRKPTQQTLDLASSVVGNVFSDLDIDANASNSAGLAGATQDYANEYDRAIQKHPARLAREIAKAHILNGLEAKRGTFGGYTVYNPKHGDWGPHLLKQYFRGIKGDYVFFDNYFNLKNGKPTLSRIKLPDDSAERKRLVEFLKSKND